MAKQMREDGMRETQKRKEWRPPGSLDTPEPPNGFKYRWVRYAVKNDDDTRNVVNRMQEGYEFVDPKELGEDFVAHVATDGKQAGRVIQGDLVLCKIPVENVEAREAYVQGRTQMLQDSVDQQLLRNQTEEMPISIDRKSSVTRGKPNFELDE
jgi:hypothetical protein